MIVCKFGGTSLADATGIRRAAAIVRADSARRFVVVSAPGKRFAGDEKITDLLLRAAQGDGDALRAVLARFQEMARRLGVEMDGELRRAAAEIPARGAEYAASRGEYLCAILLAKYLRWEFVDAAEVIRLRDGRAEPQPSYDCLLRRLKPLKMCIRDRPHAVRRLFHARAHRGRRLLQSCESRHVAGSAVSQKRLTERIHEIRRI